MDIYVCVGSSCHIKGSYPIIELLKENIAKHHLENKVNLKASFCLGKCTNGVSIKNIGIIHNREYEEGVLKISFYDQASSEKAMEQLERHRYKVFKH